MRSGLNPTFTNDFDYFLLFSLCACRMEFKPFLEDQRDFSICQTDDQRTSFCSDPAFCLLVIKIDEES